MFSMCSIDGYIGWDIGEIPIRPTLLNNKSDPLLEKIWIKH